MKFLVVFLSVTLLNLNSIDLKVLRFVYKDAATNAKIAAKLYTQLEKITKTDKVELVAYKGASIALKGRYSKKIKSKIEYFKKGIEFVEYAIQKAPNNIEIRLIRLSIQENIPRILKYKKNIKEDKHLILKHYKNIKSPSLKKYIGSYILQSKAFTEEEKNKI